MGLGGGCIGLKGIHSAKIQYKTETRIVQGIPYKIKSSNVSWCCNPCGWNVWINGEKKYCNLITREEAISSVLSRYIIKSKQKA